MPKRIGATTNAVRSRANAWKAGSARRLVEPLATRGWSRWTVAMSGPLLLKTIDLNYRKRCLLRQAFCVLDSPRGTLDGPRAADRRRGGARPADPARPLPTADPRGRVDDARRGRR